jgi:hypothetical protein
MGHARGLECRNFSPLRPVAIGDVTHSEGFRQGAILLSPRQLRQQCDVQAAPCLNRRAVAAGRLMAHQDHGWRIEIK